MKNITKRFIADESGATAIEYGLVAAMMAIAVVTIFKAFGSKLGEAFGTIGDRLKSQATNISAN